MNFHDTVAPLIYNPDKRPLHDYLRAEGLLANNVDCQHCQQPMKLVDRPDDQEKFSWRCSNGRCAWTHSRMSVKTRSFFEKTKVPLTKWLHVIVLWTIETSVTNTCALTSLSMHSHRPFPVPERFMRKEVTAESSSAWWYRRYRRCGHHLRDRRKLFLPQDQIPSRTSTTAESVGFWNSRYMYQQ